MKCPYCGNKLERGNVVSNGRVMMFSLRKHPILFKPKEGEVLLGESMFNNVVVEADICRWCKKTTISYE